MKFRSLLSVAFVSTLLLMSFASKALAEDKKAVGGRFSTIFSADPKKAKKDWQKVATYDIKGDGKEDVDKKALERYKASLIAISLLPPINPYLPFLEKKIFAQHWDLWIVRYELENQNCPSAGEEEAANTDFTALHTQTCSVDVEYEEVGDVLDTSGVTLDTIEPAVIDNLIGGSFQTPARPAE